MRKRPPRKPSDIWIARYMQQTNGEDFLQIGIGQWEWPVLEFTGMPIHHLASYLTKLSAWLKFKEGKRK